MLETGYYFNLQKGCYNWQRAEDFKNIFSMSLWSWQLSCCSSGMPGMRVKRAQLSFGVAESMPCQESSAQRLQEWPQPLYTSLFRCVNEVRSLLGKCSALNENLDSLRWPHGVLRNCGSLDLKHLRFRSKPQIYRGKKKKKLYRGKNEFLLYKFNPVTLS